LCDQAKEVTMKKLAAVLGMLLMGCSSGNLPDKDVTGRPGDAMVIKAAGAVAFIECPGGYDPRDDLPVGTRVQLVGHGFSVDAGLTNQMDKVVALEGPHKNRTMYLFPWHLGLDR
jgi:hypothetical protein